MKSKNNTNVLWYEGEFDQHKGKFLNSVIRYTPNQINGILSSNPHTSLDEFISKKNIPLFTNVDELGDFDKFIITSLHFNKNDLDKYLPLLKNILERGATIINGSHTFISPEFEEYDDQITDLRNNLSDQKLFTGKIVEKKNQKRILTVGMDCNIGKMTTSLELYNLFKKTGYNVDFIATGQIGMLIHGNGIPLDRSIVDFTSGVMENYLLNYDNKNLLIEGQGSIFTPLYSGLALAQIHGCAPDYMILCNDTERKSPRYFPNINLPTIQKAIDMHESVARLVNPNSKVICVSSNTSSMDEESSTRYLKNLEKELKLPVFDPIRNKLTQIPEAIAKCISLY